MPAEAPSPSLEDLRLRTPALHPVGCWSTGCAPLPAARAADERATGLSPQARLASTPRARAGAATCPARRRRACGCRCAPAATPRASARPRARGRPGARATRKRASACARAPDGRGRPAGARWQPPAAPQRADAKERLRTMTMAPPRPLMRAYLRVCHAGRERSARPTWRAGACPSRARRCFRPGRCALRVNRRSLSHGPDPGLESSSARGPALHRSRLQRLQCKQSACAAWPLRACSSTSSGCAWLLERGLDTICVRQHC
jgi:hypothetical protein